MASSALTASITRNPHSRRYPATRCRTNRTSSTTITVGWPSPCCCSAGLQADIGFRSSSLLLPPRLEGSACRNGDGVHRQRRDAQPALPVGELDGGLHLPTVGVAHALVDRGERNPAGMSLSHRLDLHCRQKRPDQGGSLLHQGPTARTRDCCSLVPVTF